MPLKQGNLKKLACDPERTIDIGDLADLVLYQMLLALACLAEHKIVHRDIKPENILWEDNNGAYHFRLGDFGLSNTLKKAVTPAGTEPFMAPEIFYGGKQTTKVDIWSLFATVVWVKNVNDFQQEASNRRPEVMQKILMQIAETVPEFYRIRRMASWKPKDRPSAKQVLKILEKSNEVDDMADLMANGLLLDPMGEDEEDDGGVGPSLQPGLPYYEPYQPYLPEQYNWEGEEEEEGGSNTYVPPPVGASPRTRGAAYMGEVCNSDRTFTSR
jgi:serine/threonine protein kinase